MKNFLKAFFLIAVISMAVQSCATGVKLGNSGCKVTANYSVVNDDAYACIFCDSVKSNALKTFKSIFPKQKIWRQDGALLNYRVK